jgi:hypothetical protein
MEGEKLLFVVASDEGPVEDFLHLPGQAVGLVDAALMRASQ